MLALLAAATTGAAAAPPSTSCAGQDATITAANEAAAEGSLLCLINAYRRDNGVAPLERDPSLELAARRHSHDMVARGYFDHQAKAPAPHGTWHWHRAEAAGYPADELDTGENIGAAFPEGTPLGLFEAWRNSPSHNGNMLDRRWVASGLGIVRGWPGDAADPATFEQGATVTGMFGAGAGGDEAEKPSGCESEKRALKAAGKRLARAKKAKAKAKRSRSSRLRSKSRAATRAKRNKKKAKQRYAECRSGLE